MKSKETLTSYLWFSFQCRLLVMVGKGRDDCVVIIRHSIQEFPAHVGRPEDFLPLMCAFVNVFSQRCKGVSFWVPETAAYTLNQGQSDNDGSQGANIECRVKYGQNIPTKQEPG